MKKIKVYNIIFIQDHNSLDHFCSDLGVEGISDLSDEQIFDHLLNWDMGLEHCASNVYNEDQLNTEFLGYQFAPVGQVISDDQTEGYLLSRNDNLGYIGLSYYKTLK